MYKLSVCSSCVSSLTDFDEFWHRGESVEINIGGDGIGQNLFIKAMPMSSSEL
jgi:hypothetical protein